MAANWKKILFEGENIDVRSISASKITELTDAAAVSGLPVLSYDDPATGGTGHIRQISQTGLNSPQGNVIGTISASNHLGGVGVPLNNFNFAGDSLLLAGTVNLMPDGTNTPVVKIFITSPEDGTVTATYAAAPGYITGSAQLNIISGSLVDGILGNLGNDWLTSINPFLTRIATNTSNIEDHTEQVDPDDPIQVDLPTIEGSIPNWLASTSNLWRNRYSGTYLSSDFNDIPPLDPNADIVGRHSIYWLSASFLGGFPDGTPSLSASFSTLTGSIVSVSESINPLLVSQENLNDETGSYAPSADNGNFATIAGLDSATVFSIEDSVNIDQISFIDTDAGGNDLNQGKRLRLGVLDEDTDLFNLTVAGDFTANTLLLNAEGIDFQQADVSITNGGIKYGTSSLHNHSYLGQVTVTGSSIAVTGPVIVNGDFFPATPDNLGNIAPGNSSLMAVVASGSSNALQQSAISGSDNALVAMITGSANEDVQLIEAAITAIQTEIGDATADATAIDNLEAGFSTNSDSLLNTYNSGFLFTTASSNAAFSAGDVFGSKLVLRTTASFSATQTTGTDTILTVAHSSNTIKYTFNTASFISVTGIYTGSGEIEDDVAALDIYGQHTDGILTQSNTPANILYIQNLATNLPGGAGQQFLTSSGDFDDVDNLDNLANGVLSPVQGVLDFLLEGSYQFGATGSQMGTDGNPTFSTLTVDGNLTVGGDIVKVNTTNLNIKDQFIAVNYGATTPDGESASERDKDGGIIVGTGNESGSLLFFDNSDCTWGFVGADTPSTATDYSSNFSNPTVADVRVRVVAQGAGAPPDVTTIGYGTGSADTERGIMWCDTTGDEGVYIYA
jgi:hypothetical protein